MSAIERGFRRFNQVTTLFSNTKRCHTFYGQGLSDKDSLWTSRDGQSFTLVQDNLSANGSFVIPSNYRYNSYWQIQHSDYSEGGLRYWDAWWPGQVFLLSDPILWYYYGWPVTNPAWTGGSIHDAYTNQLENIPLSYSFVSSVIDPLNSRTELVPRALPPYYFSYYAPGDNPYVSRLGWDATVVSGTVTVLWKYTVDVTNGTSTYISSTPSEGWVTENIVTNSGTFNVAGTAARGTLTLYDDEGKLLQRGIDWEVPTDGTPGKHFHLISGYTGVLTVTYLNMARRLTRGQRSRVLTTSNTSADRRRYSDIKPI